MARKKYNENSEGEEIQKLDSIIPSVDLPEQEEKEDELEDIFPSNPEGLKKLRFKKLGGGSLRGIPGYPIIKPGQIFEAYLGDISPRFLPSLQCLDTDLMTEQLQTSPQSNPKEYLWKVKQVKPGKWDVIGKNEKAINETSMTEDEAIKLAKALNN